MKLRPQFLTRTLSTGYTLIEVLAAAAVVSVGMAAAVSLSASLMREEELAWRVAVTRNYQENMARLWQLGMARPGSSLPSSITAVLPAPADSVRLSEAISGTPTLIELGSGDGSGLEYAQVLASVNISADPDKAIQGASLNLMVYRPSLPSALRLTTSP